MVNCALLAVRTRMCFLLSRHCVNTTFKFNVRVSCGVLCSDSEHSFDDYNDFVDAAVSCTVIATPPVFFGASALLLRLSFFFMFFCFCSCVFFLCFFLVFFLLFFLFFCEMRVVLSFLFCSFFLPFYPFRFALCSSERTWQALPPRRWQTSSSPTSR